MPDTPSNFDSVYPDLLQARLARLNVLEARHELLGLFAALEHFRRDLHAQDSIDRVLQVIQRYVAGLGLFQTTGFWLLNPVDCGFDCALAESRVEQPKLHALVDQEIRSGRFAEALRQPSPVFIHLDTPDGSGRGVLHSLALSGQVMGMFCGVLRPNLPVSQEITFSLLSVLLGAGADALGTLSKTTELASEIDTLSELLPLCSWCKKVRNDSGYWEQIEKYLTSHSNASITHGICPECQEQLLTGLPDP